MGIMDSRYFCEDSQASSHARAQVTPAITSSQPVPPVTMLLRTSAVLPHPQSQAKRPRKDRGPNWLPHEVLALIAIKRTMHLQELDAVDSRDLMTPDITKWTRVAEHVMRSGSSPCFRDASACKTKWNQLLSDYKRISDFLSRTGRNSPKYWEMSPSERKAESLPRQFSQDVYCVIHDWYGARPLIQPPHVRDTLARLDSNLSRGGNGVHGDEECDGSDAETDDPLQTSQADAFETLEHSNVPPSPLRSSSIPSKNVAPSLQPQSPGSHAFVGVPPGITRHLLSSSESSQFTMPRRPGNTAVRRKNVSGHSVIAEATKATGAVMATQMHDIAESSRKLERSKIDVQLRIFSEQMAYQLEKDRRIYENATAANENARLSIMKQGEMVSCLTHLSHVLSVGLTMQTHSPTTPLEKVEELANNLASDASLPQQKP